MATAPVSARESSGFGWLVAAGLAYALAVYFTLPAGVVAMNDDFGYLRSVVATLQHGYPRVDDWLEPWSVGLSGLSALTYRATGSFLAATQGVQAVLSGLSLAALAQLLRRRGLGLGSALLLAAALLTVPTIFWKTLEYTGLVVTLPCLLLAALAAEQGLWGWFGVVWVFALVTRQSAAAWGMLPLFGVLHAWRQAKDKSAWRAPAFALVAGVCAYLLASVALNKTHAQLSVTDRMFQNLQGARSAELAAIGLLVLGGCAGLGGWLMSAAWRRQAWWLAPLALAAVALVWRGIEWHDRIYLEHARYSEGSGNCYLPALLALGALGWACRRFTLDVAFAAAGAGALLLVCLRRDVWDYYLIDLAFFGFLAVRPVAVQERARSAVTGWMVALAALVLLGVHQKFVRSFKEEIDRRWAEIDLAERALRDGRLELKEIRFLPFGYIGWQLFPVSLTRLPDGRTEGSDFFDYLEHGNHGTVMRTLEGNVSGPSAVDPALIAGTYPYRWLGRRQFGLHRQMWANPVIAPKRALPPDFKRPVFPLNDAEWRALVAGKLEATAAVRK